jgi:hypothetical protein
MARDVTVKFDNNLDREITRLREKFPLLDADKLTRKAQVNVMQRDGEILYYK